MIGGGALLVALMSVVSIAASSSSSVPDARPPLNQRRFVSKAIEGEIVRVQTALAAIGTPFADAYATLFANTFANTLDTTVSFVDGLAFLITGDIDAMWLRDSTNAVMGYMPFLTQDAALQNLVATLVKRQTQQINTDPYANAHYASHELLSPWMTDQTSSLTFAGTRTQAMTLRLHERKFEIDSHGAFLALAASYFEATGDSSPFTAAFRTALNTVLAILSQQQQLDTDATQGPASAPYLFTRKTSQPSDTLQDGYGAPGRACGLIRSAFRPSDDALVLPYNVPVNAYVSVQLQRAAKLAATLGWSAEASAASTLGASVAAAVRQCGVAVHPTAGPVFAFEVNGYGSALFMDDGNVPSLLSLPLIGFCNASDPVYAATRKMVLSNATNPFYYVGTAGEGIGSPHTGYGRIWPMSIIVRAMTTSDAAEIKASLRTLLASHAGTGLMHESFWRDDVGSFTRPWFAWCNAMLGELVQLLLATNPSVFT